MPCSIDRPPRLRDRYMAPDGPPAYYRHRDGGGDAHVRLVCDECGPGNVRRGGRSGLCEFELAAQVLRLQHEVWHQRLILAVRLVLDGGEELALLLLHELAILRRPGNQDVVGDDDRPAM